MTTNITANELREKYLRFFSEKCHAIIPSASIIPENDPTVLFTTAGMHPLVPYLLGASHPMGRRLTDVQKCIRTGDIDEVGDAGHLTFFEMLGNWSLGDYFKKEMIPWSWEFLTSKQWLGLDPDKLAFTVFAGDETCPRDMESYELWRSCGVAEDHIFFLGREHNWWGPAGMTGPCGPDTEMFIIRDGEPCGPDCSPACSCGHYLEIWNDVFMQYNKQADGSFVPLSQKNVDTGMGLERTICVLTGKKTVYETDLFVDIIGKIEELSGKKYAEAEGEDLKAFRVIADHVRTSTFIMGDIKGISPSNTDKGYVLRRLIRRAIRFANQLGIPEGSLTSIAAVIIAQYSAVYPELKQNEGFIFEQLALEEERFQHTIRQGIKEFGKVLRRVTAFDDYRAAMNAAMGKEFFTANARLGKQLASSGAILPQPEQYAPLFDSYQKAIAELGKAVAGIAAMPSPARVIDGVSAFKLYDTYGFPIEMTCELAAENGVSVDIEGFDARFRQHQEVSHAGSDQRFKGGLADNGEATARLHTATHLLLAALKKVLSPDIQQKGSNITAERLRLDFNFARRVTPEELAEIERLVNEAIAASIPVVCEEMSLEAARESGATGVFGDKYGAMVKVYTMGEVSKEICGGPHAANTADLVSFKIQKEESSSSGVRRIRAVIGANS